MEEKKSFKISVSSFLLFIAIIVIIIMAFYIYKQNINNNKENTNLKTDTNNIKDTNLETDINNIKNTIEEVQEKDNSISNDIVEQQEKIVKYEYTSANQLAVQGYPQTLKVYELTENELEFEYNSGFDFDKSTLDRQVIGVARANAEQLYEFEEIVAGHEYRLMFEFNEQDNSVKIYEFDNGEEMGWMNLYG